MKKNVLLLLSFGFLVGCGTPKVELTTYDYKREVLLKMVDKNDEKARKEYEETQAKLELAMKKGNVEAKKEHYEWDEIYSSLRMRVKKTNTPRTIPRRNY
jgi:transcriptional regulator NrdR family protein